MTAVAMSDTTDVHPPADRLVRADCDGMTITDSTDARDREEHEVRSALEDNQRTLAVTAQPPAPRSPRRPA